MQLDRFPVVSSPNRTVVGSPPRSIDLIVIHDMEAPERLDTAENVAAYFSRPSVRASAHYCVDRNSIVQCVPLEDVAWAAPGANHNGIQLEFAGYARQTPAQWADAYSKDMLRLGAELTAALCKRFDIPVRFVDSTGLKRGYRGITTHHQVSLAFGMSSHTDPGPSFPRLGFISEVLDEFEELNPPKPKVVTFQLLIGGKVVATSSPVTGLLPGSERLRLSTFLRNQVRRIHAQLILHDGLPVTIERKVT